MIIRKVGYGYLWGQGRAASQEGHMVEEDLESCKYSRLLPRGNLQRGLL